jgi:acyl transferase domain-containing protein/NADPH:quinone reductase-like Zn-dependent oxidoreductase/acyl carrier protein
MKKDPIAIVGIACRFPGNCKTPDEFWQLLVNGANAISEIDADRWSTDYYYHPDRNAPGKTYARHAGQLTDIFHFDPEFFGISPREAMQMDPQQRLLLEMTWEALEYGNQIPKQLAGSACSVYIGISSLDYANSRFDDPSLADSYFMTGNTLSIAANRISHMFDLRGPSMAVDTACSSSLVALHQACSSIWNGESSMSIAGAMHLLLSPFPFIGFSKASMLSPDGQCRVFDAGANGYVRAEGGAVLYLKPLALAEADGDPIHALILNTGVNTDGAKPTMVVPEERAQKELLERVYTEAGVDPAALHYLEAHGTGTPVGDPIEARSISQGIALKRDKDKPLMIGSVKSNIGHLETASGAAGLIKIIMSLRNRAIPASINFNTPNPNIDFETLNLKVADTFTPLDDVPGSLLMGVNSFGFGGSNAHAILSEYRQEEQASAHEQDIVCPPLILTANNQESLRQRARQFSELIKQGTNEASCYNIFYTAAKFRQRLKYGLIAWGDSYDAIAEQLDSFYQGKNCRQLISTVKPVVKGKTAFVFSGNGSQWHGMGQGLMKEAIFRDTISGIDEIFIPLGNWSIAAELTNTDHPDRLQRTEIAQPALFAIQVGILNLLRSLGIEADAVLGHSVGELAAAYAAGILSLEQAVHVIYHRSTAQAKTRGMGKMVAAQITADRADELAAGIGKGLEVAAINSPRSVSLSGPEETIREIYTLLREDQVICRILDLDYPFHNELMNRVKHEFLEQLGEISPDCGNIDFISTVSGAKADGKSLDSGYWWKNLRKTVHFEQAVQTLIDQDFSIYIEIGPHPVLRTYIHECLGPARTDSSVISTLRRNADNEAELISKAAYETLLLSGDNSLDSFFNTNSAYIKLPGYPWTHAEYRTTSTNEATNLLLDHPLLGFRLNAMEGVWHNQLDTCKHPLLAEHVVDGMVVFPAAAFVEMALAASDLTFEREGHEIANLEIRRPLILEDHQTRDIQFILSTDDLGFIIKSRPRLGNQSWVVNVVGKLISSISGCKQSAYDLAQLKASATRIVHKDEIYALARQIGLDYGPSFQGVESVWVCTDKLLLSKLGAGRSVHNLQGRYVLDPVILDAAFHTLFPALPGAGNSGRALTAAFLPMGFDDIRINKSSESIAYCLCEILAYSLKSIRARFLLLDAGGNVVARIENCFFKQMPGARNRNIPDLYHFRQVPRNHIDAHTPVSLPDPDDLTACIAENCINITALDYEKVQIEQIQPLYEALALAIAEQTLREFGAHMGEFTVDSLLASSGIATDHIRFVHYILQLLEEDGKAVYHNGTWKMVLDSAHDDSLPIWRSIVADYPRFLPDMLATSRWGFELVNNLQHRPGQIREENSEKSRYNFATSGLAKHIVNEVLDYIVREWPGRKRRLRIVEFMDCDVCVSKQIITRLPGEFCDYQLITTNDALQLKAEQQFRGYPNVRVSCINQGENSIKHDFRKGEFDVLISANWLYQCDDILKTLDEFSYLLASGGLLLITERKPDRLLDINLGIDPAWWSRSMQDEQPVSRLMHADDWLVAIEKAEYQSAVILNEKISPDAREFVIAAYRPVRSRRDDNNSLDQRYNWLLICNNQGHSRRIAESIRAELSARGMQTVIACSNNNMKRPNSKEDNARLKNLEDYQELLAELKNDNYPLSQVLYLSGLDLQINASITNLTREQGSCCMDVVNILKSLESTSMDNNPRIWLITSHVTQHDPDQDSNDYQSLPNQAPLWGLGRVARNEFPNIDCRQVELQLGSNPQKIARSLITEIFHADDENEVILTDDARKVMRMDRFTPSMPAAADGTVDEPQAAVKFGLAFSTPGNLDNLYWKQIAPPPPAADEIEIKVMAGGLNFRDVMFAAGLLPEEILENGFAGATLGMECAGIVTAVGNSVQRFKPGDQVIAFAPACFASHVVTRTTAVTLKPEHWTWEEAVTVPATFFTVYYSLHHLARLAEGERILIHGAAGGVGLAAIQYAHYCGAEIFATAGTREKRKFLELLGVDHVLDSRSLEFADAIMSLTGGEGVDVILNSLSGEAVDKNFTVLKPFGRFVELGKRDFLENRNIGSRRFRNNISYFAVDADQLILNQPRLTGQLFDEMMELFRQGEFRPLTHTVYPACDITAAFRTMHQSAHIGKIVVSMQPGPLQVSRVEPTRQVLQLNDKASYLVTGGTGGFGFATARWLAEKGARHIILLGRREMLAEQELNVIEQLKRDGVEMLHKQCDVADPVALKKILREIESSQAPLRGIVHAAMVLEDAAIRNLDEEAFQTVFKPKIQGAWCLHQLTSDIALDFFILYSSATTCLGNPGQANYVAANTYLEALARYRRAQGLPAMAVAWDAIMDTGYLARNDALRETFSKRLGINGITSRHAFQALEQAMGNNLVDIALMNANWQSIKRLLPSMTSPMYINLVHGLDENESMGNAADIHELIQGLSREEVHVLISGLLGDEVSRILQLPRDKVEHTRALQELGVDSLMAMELVAAIETRFSVEIPIMALSDNITIDSLAVRLTRMLTDETAGQEDIDNDTLLIHSMAMAHAEDVPEAELEEFVHDYGQQTDNIRRIIQ